MESNRLNAIPGAAAGEGISAQILLGCRMGDREAQRQLYELSKQMVFRLMVRFVGREAAEDLTQQVYLKVFRRVDQFNENSRFETWLYRVAANEALQYLRARGNRSCEPLTQEPKTNTTRVDDQFAHKELLEESLLRLDPELRLAFILREIDGLSYAEIAEVLAIPEGTVGSRLNAARRQLQTFLLSQGWGE